MNDKGPLSPAIILIGHSSRTVDRIYKMLTKIGSQDLEKNVTFYDDHGISFQLDECKFANVEIIVAIMLKKVGFWGASKLGRKKGFCTCGKKKMFKL